MMLEHELYKILKKNGFQVPTHKVLKFNEIPDIDFYPIALKLESKKVIHKSEVGAVKTGIANCAQYKKGHDAILSSLRKYGIEIDFKEDRLLASNMIKGEEFFVGVVNDDIFGTVIVFGKGGIFLELYKDICYIDIHAKKDEIKRAINLTQISKLFHGFRNSELRIDTAVKFIQKVQKFIIENKDIKEMDLNPVILNSDGFHIVDVRIKNESRVCQSQKYKRNNRSNFFANINVAIIGASTVKTKVGYAVAKNALDFSGNIYFVNSKGGELFGKIFYKKATDIPGDIDTAIITIPSHFVLEQVEELIKKNIKNIIIISAGFKEIGDYESEAKILDLALKYDINLIGPNCLGYYESTKNLNVTFATEHIIKGDIAFLAQSGAVLSSLMDKAYQNGIGFSHIISLGNMIDLSFGEAIKMLNEEESCKYISIYAEGISDGKAFLQAIRESKKPIYVYKTGKSKASQKAAFSHTGNLSGNYEMFKGLLESVGVIIEDNIEALIFEPKFKSRSIAVITNAGGPATILTDYIIDRGKKLYQLKSNEIKVLDSILPDNWSKNNPIDIIGDALSNRYDACLKVVDGIVDVDLIYVIVTPQFMTDAVAIAKVIEKYRNKKTLIPIFLGGELLKEAKEYFEQKQIPYFSTLHEATAFL